MTDTPPAIIFYCTLWCPDCRRARRFLDERNVAYRCVDIEEDPEAATFVKQVNHGFHSVPTLVFPDGTTLVEPSTNQLAVKLREQGLA
jgi:glutaredoxin-like protein